MFVSLVSIKNGLRISPCILSFFSLLFLRSKFDDVDPIFRYTLTFNHRIGKNNDRFGNFFENLTLRGLSPM